MDYSTVFSQILSTADKFLPKSDAWTVLAGFVNEDGKVLSIATGVKCLPINFLFDSEGNRLPCYHDLIRDSHAEVFARRALIRYCLLNPNNAISKVWLFTTQVPCGDASITNEGDDIIDFGLARGKDDWSRIGLLRTKPGRADAPPTHCLSCSDKILKWIRLGVQGKYLPNKIELRGIVIGGEASQESVKRAFLKRTSVPELQVELVPSIEYKNSKELLGEPAFEARAWCLGMTKAETIVQGRKQGSKKTMTNLPLPQSSRSLFCDTSLQMLCKRKNNAYEDSKDLLFTTCPLFRFWPRITMNALPESLRSIANMSQSEPADEMGRKRLRTQ